MRFNAGCVRGLIIAIAYVSQMALTTNHALAVPVYKSGHADIGVDYHAGNDSFDLVYHFGSDARSESMPDTDIANLAIAPSDVAVRVPDPSVPRPAGAQWDFLGTPAGQPIWFDPQVQEPGKPFLGFATTVLSPTVWPGGLTWSLTGILTRPVGGEFSVWQTGFFGDPIVKFDTVDGIDPLNDDKFTQSAGGHDHYNWGFTKPGVYQVELAAHGTHSINGDASGSGVFTFYVTNAVPEPTGVSLAVIGALGLVTFRRLRSQRRCQYQTSIEGIRCTHVARAVSTF